MREILISDECIEFVSKSNIRVKTKFNYLIEVIGEQKIIHKAIVDKLVNSRFYELRIKADNQIRIIIFSIDNENFNESKKIILLNGFIKRTNKDYIKALKVAEYLLTKYDKELD
ncbi:MAG: type II toxin-antitoxin system RelE/ParE family toxin [Saprospiraceae bacterium]|nr:type II toxin-antitoxin system RelE/ParE family toxin [Saprospiraceae bacterium]